jgi:hypothetical protein
MNRIDIRSILSLAIGLTLLSGCMPPPRPYPAPVEHRRHLPPPPVSTPSDVQVIPQPDYGTGFEPVDDPYDAGDDYGFAPMDEPPMDEPPIAEPPLDQPPGNDAPPTGEPQAPEPVVASPVQALTDKARQQAADGHYEAAAGSLERALRITPKDPDLWYELAGIRLAQGEVDEAGDLAVKSRTLAIGQPGRQARSWRLLAKVHEQQGDLDAADQAFETAAELDSLIR